MHRFRLSFSLVLALIWAAPCIAAGPPADDEPKAVPCQPAAELMASCPGNTPRECHTINSDSDKMASLRLPIDRLYDVEGYVCDPTGTPLPFVQVTLISLSGQPDGVVRRGDLARFKNDEQESPVCEAGEYGRFGISGIPGGTYALDVTSGSAAASVNFSVVLTPILE